VVDETVGALLDYTSARKISPSADATFALFNDFEGGFRSGYGSCAT